MKKVKINVLKPFRFTTPADREQGVPLPVERVFTVGEHEIDAKIAKHPWMAAPNLADGAIESAQACGARLAAAEKRAKAAQVEADNARAQADFAMQRQVRAQPRKKEAIDLTAEELNTPIGVLRARQERKGAQEKIGV